MKKSITFFSIAALVACTNAKTDIKTEAVLDRDAVQAEISTVNRQFAEAGLKGDSAAAIALYHPESRTFPPGRDAINREVMASGFKLRPGVVIIKLNFNSTEVFGGPHEVTEIGTWDRVDSPNVVMNGKYFRDLEKR